MIKTKQNNLLRNSNSLKKLLAVIIVAVILVLVKELGLLSKSVLLVVQYIGIYSIFVIGINMVNGFLGVFSLTHAGFMAVGAYAAAISSKYLFTARWMFPFTLLTGGIVALLVGILVAIPSFKAKGDYLAIITLGFSLIIQSILQNLNFVGASKGMNNISISTNIYWVFACLIFAIILVSKIVNSKYGRSLKAIREDEVASKLVSVDVKRNKTIAFAVSAFLIGISGALISHLLGYTSPSAYGFTNIVDGLVMVYLGGMGSIVGSIFGATVWIMLVQLLKDLGTWRWVVGGSLLCIIMIIRPKGIFGYMELKDIVAIAKSKIEDIKNMGKSNEE